MTPRPPSPSPVVLAITRAVLGVLLPAARRVEAEGDLIELWQHRAAAGRRDLRRAWLRDLAGIGLARTSQRTTRSTLTPHRRWRLGGFAMRQDIQFALRMMRRRPGSTLATVLTLAIGIGAGSAIFTAVDRLLLRPLPLPDADRLVLVEHAPLVFGRGVDGGLAPSFTALPAIEAAGTWALGGMNLDDGEGVRVTAAVVDDGFFATVGVAPLVGQPLPKADGTSRFAVLSYDLWRSRFGADRAVVGRTVTLNSRAYTITGVMPPGVVFPGRTEVWVPPMVDLQATGTAYAPEVIARIARGTSLEQAREAVVAYDHGRRTAQGQPPPPPDETMALLPLGRELTAQARPTLLLLAGSVVLLLMVISASVANLLLSRVAARDTELTLRRALGATRWRLARQLFVESLLLSLTGGALGVVAASWALDTLRVLTPAWIDTPAFGGVDLGFLALATGVSVLTALVFGVAPGLAAAARQSADVVRSGREAGRPPRWHRFRSGLIVGQMAIALALLAASAAAVGALVDATRIDPGFGSRRALAFTVTLPMARFGSMPAVSAFFEQAHDRLRSVPGVQRVGATGFLPGSNELGAGTAISVHGRPAPASADRIYATYLSASSDYFAVAGIRLVAGRSFTPADRTGAPRVVVLSEATARRLFADGESAVGQSIQTSFAPTPHEVIGVVADVRLRSLNATSRSLQQMYVPMLQSPPFGNLSFIADVEGEPMAAAASIRAAFAEIDRTIPIYNMQPLDAAIDRYLASHRLAGSLVTGFAVVTLFVAAIGLYGLMAQRVIERTREIGIRMALGADPRSVRRRLVRQGASLAVIGAAIGAAGAAGALELFQAVVPTLTSTSPWSVAASAGILMAIGVGATWLPATRVLKIDPMQALRSE